MARIKYVGSLESTSWQGVTFWQGLWTSAAGLDDDDIATLSANPTFLVDAANDGPLDAPPSPPDPPPASPIVPTGVEPDGDDAEDDAAEASPAPSLSI